MYPKWEHFRKKSEKLTFQMQGNTIMKFLIDLVIDKNWLQMLLTEKVEKYPNNKNNDKF